MCGTLIAPVCTSQFALAGEWSGYSGLEFRGFTQTAQLPVQEHATNLSLVFETEYYHDWDDGYQGFAFVPFFRLDENDPERTHFDLRELNYFKASDNWELRVGVRKVFWGVTEFQHLVDIINQDDLVENIDTEDKLGQPMVNLAFIRDWGTVDLFVMPYFRERTFPGRKGRLRAIPLVDTDRATYESSAEEKHVDVAIRYSHYFGDWDVGLAHFRGTSRDPRLLFSQDSVGNPVLVPFYEIINQTSIDLQATKGNMLWKLEALHRSGQGETFHALAAGFEYTFVGVMGSAVDVGVLGEYHYDERGQTFDTIFEDDIAIGTRIALNDMNSTEALIGVIVDRETGGQFYSIEASRRLSGNWLLELQSRLFVDQKASDPASVLGQDDYVELFLTYNF